METIQAVIADPQDFTRIGICTSLSQHFNNHIDFHYAIGKAEIKSKVSETKASIVIMDYDLLDFKSMEEIVDLRKALSNMAFLIISDYHSAADIVKLIDGGITNYIMKSSTLDELLEAFHAALSSRKYFCSEILDVLFEQKGVIRAKKPQGKLTATEIEIVQLIAQGLTTKEIALQKHLSFHTIITHRKNIFRKLTITNSSELLMYAMRSGIVDSTEYYI